MVQWGRRFRPSLVTYRAEGSELMRAIPARAIETEVRPAKRPPLTQAFRALRNTNYRLFWCGQIISMIGTWMDRIAQAWLVLRLTDSPLALGILTACQTLPVLILALFGGVIADRVPKRRLLVISLRIGDTRLNPSHVRGWLGLLRHKAFPPRPASGMEA